MISKIIMSGCLLLSVISIKFDICLDTLYFVEKHTLYKLFIATSNIKQAQPRSKATIRYFKNQIKLISRTHFRIV